MRMSECGCGMVGVRLQDTVAADVPVAPRGRSNARGARGGSDEKLREVPEADGGVAERVATLRRTVLLDVEVLHPGERRLREDRPIVDLSLAEGDDARGAMPLRLIGHAVQRGEAGDVLHVPDLEPARRPFEQVERALTRDRRPPDVEL